MVKHEEAFAEAARLRETQLMGEREELRKLLAASEIRLRETTATLESRAASAEQQLQLHVAKQARDADHLARRVQLRANRCSEAALTKGLEEPGLLANFGHLCWLVASQEACNRACQTDGEEHVTLEAACQTYSEDCPACRHDATDSLPETSAEDGAGEFTHSDLLMQPSIRSIRPSKLCDLAANQPEAGATALMFEAMASATVDDIMEWRVTCCQTVQPKVLIHHLSEMGRLDRSQSIIDFSVQFDFAATDPVTSEVQMAKDCRQNKLFECRWWCMRLACADKTHFPESDVNDIVTENLRSLLVHCCDVDVSVRLAAHHLVENYACGGLPFVQQLIAEAMLDRMEDLLPESVEISKEALEQAMQCATHLTSILRALTKPQRQKWVSLLVRALQNVEQDQDQDQETLISDLKILWRVDGDPRRSYAEAEQQLKAFSMHANRHLQTEIWHLHYC
ncbi:unnamed protein product [Symbiodinium sp. CCMP2592]|nr:unnamed protein product [Symbiodinium sp. CCMP2592]